MSSTDLARGEMRLAYRAAVADLMATGATRGEAEAAVREELVHALNPMWAGMTAGWTQAAAVVGEAIRQLGAALTALTAVSPARRGIPPWQVPAGRRRRDFRLVR